jgi:serine/threonine protein phosphatase PrpC
VRCFWAGDSRAYLLRGASLTQLSRDHSLVQQLVDAGMLDPDRAHDHPNGNMITRAVGAADELRTDVVEHDLAAGDLILLASDGVTRVVTDGELASALRSSAPLAETADGLVWTVLQRGAPDNLTFILLRISD